MHSICKTKKKKWNNRTWVSLFGEIQKWGYLLKWVILMESYDVVIYPAILLACFLFNLIEELFFFPLLCCFLSSLEGIQEQH